MVGPAVLAVEAEVAHPHELEAGGGGEAGHVRLHLAAGEDLQALGVQALQEILVGGVGGLVEKEVVIDADLRA